MMTFHFKNKEEFYERIADGSLQKSMMEYLERWADMELPIEEDTLIYNFEAEFECVLENGKRCITDEEVAHRRGEIAVRFHDVIRSVWRRYQKSIPISGKDFTLTELSTDMWRLIWIDTEFQMKTEYLFWRNQIFVCSASGNAVFTFPQRLSWKDDWTKMKPSQFADALSTGDFKSHLWLGSAAYDDIIERYRKADKEGPISLTEYERYLQYAQESSCHEEFLLRIELDEDLPYRHDQEERWLRTECRMRLNPIVAFYLRGLQVFYKCQIEGRYPLNEEDLLSNVIYRREKYETIKMS